GIRDWSVTGVQTCALPICELRPGNLIVTITGQGRSVYRVAALGSSHTRIVDPAPNRLLLVTAASPYIPAYYIEVDARLVSAPRRSEERRVGKEGRAREWPG